MGYRSKAPAAFAALAQLVEGTAGEVPVRRGQPVTSDPRDAIYLGYDGDPESETQVITAEQSWPSATSRIRDETISIVNAIYLVNGAGDFDAAMTRGYELLAIVEEALHPLPDLANLTPPRWAHVSSHEFVSIPSLNGVEVWLRFIVSVRTRL